MPKAILIAPFTEVLSLDLSLGCAYLAGIIEKNGWDIKIITPKTEYRRMSETELKNEIEKFHPEFIGLSLYTENILSMYRYITEIKSLNIPIIAGGPHPSVLPREVLNNGVDIVVRGEGEETVADLLEYFMGEKDKGDILGISYRDEKRNIIDNLNRPPIQDLDSLPFPARHLYETEANIRNKSDYSKFGKTIASRGCPFKCIYCSHKNYPHYRFRTPSNIIAEVKFLKDRYGLSTFSFEDSVFTVNKRHTIEFCEALIGKRMGIRWSCSTRLDMVEPELLEKMKEAGCYLIVYGVESLNSDTLKRLKKGIDAKLVDKVAQWMNDIDIRMNANFMWGLPWEKLEDIRGNLKGVRSKSIYFGKIMPCGIPIPFPGTELYDDFKDGYGFENWWLNPKKRYNYNPHFYQSILFSFQDSLIDNSFFKYSPQTKKELRKAADFIGKFNRRQLSLKRKILVKMFIIISKILSKISPCLEISLYQKLLFGLRHKFPRPLF